MGVDNLENSFEPRRILIAWGVNSIHVHVNFDRRTKLTYPNGTSTTYSYDPVSRLSSITHTSLTHSPLYSFTYEYDAVSNITSIGEQSAVSSEQAPSRRPARRSQRRLPTADSRLTMYSYDALYRLTGAAVNDQPSPLTQARKDESFQYDAIGNLFNAPGGSHALYDNASRLLQWGDWEMTYDESGRLTRKTAFSPQPSAISPEGTEKAES